MIEQRGLGRRPIGFRAREDKVDEVPSGVRAHFGNAPGGVVAMPRDIIGINPKWVRVEDAKLATAPWCSICAVFASDGGNAHLVGTGWLAGRATVITAAHVAAAATRGNGDLRFDLKFPGASLPAITAIDARVHDRYRGDVSALFDPFDVAALRIPPIDLPTLALVDVVPTEGPVEVPGYPEVENGTMVTDDGRASRADDRIVLHDVDTGRGHSGAPVLLEGMPNDRRPVVGLHVHGFAANPFQDRFPDRNLALAMKDDIAAFVRTHVEAWNSR